MTGTSRKHYKKKQKKLVILIFLVVMLIIIGAAIAYLVLHNRNSQRTGFREGWTGDVASAADRELTYNDHLSNYLFLGIDGTGKVSDIETMWDNGQADSLFLVSYDRAEETMQILIIPRDTITEIETFNPSGRSLGFSEDHINIQYAYGDGKMRSCEITKDAVRKLLNNIPIQGYASLRMGGMPILADVLGGVDVVVPDDSLEGYDDEFKEGETVTITSANAESFLRHRDTGESQSAIVRQGRQRVFMEALLEKAKAEAQNDSSVVTRFYDALKDYLVTSMGNDEFAKLLTATVISTQTLPGEGVEGEAYDEFYVDEAARDELVTKMFYK